MANILATIGLPFTPAKLHAHNMNVSKAFAPLDALTIEFGLSTPVKIAYSPILLEEDNMHLGPGLLLSFILISTTGCAHQAASRNPVLAAQDEPMPIRIANMRKLPPAPIMPEDVIRDAKAAFEAAKKGCSHFQNIPISVALHADRWFVDWSGQSTTVDKRTGAVSECAEVQE